MLYKGRRYFNLSNKSSHISFAEATYVVENFVFHLMPIEISSGY